METGTLSRGREKGDGTRGDREAETERRDRTRGPEAENMDVDIKNHCTRIPYCHIQLSQMFNER